MNTITRRKGNFRYDVWETNKGPTLGYCKYAIYQWYPELEMWSKKTKDSYPMTIDVTLREAERELDRYFWQEPYNEGWLDAKEGFGKSFNPHTLSEVTAVHNQEAEDEWNRGWDAYHSRTDLKLEKYYIEATKTNKTIKSLNKAISDNHDQVDEN